MSLSKPVLTTFLTTLKDRRGPAFAVVFGDDLQVQAACRSIIDSVVALEWRGFNLERFDGRSVAWDQIEASLMTPPLFPGRKLIWVENAPYFFSRDHKGELGEKILQLWAEDQKDEAGKLLLDLLAVEGWTRERWEQSTAEAAGASVGKLMGLEDDDTGEALHQLIAHCKIRGLELKRRPGSEEQAVLALLDQGLPPWNFLLLTPVQIDRRTRIYKRLYELGAVFHLDFERDRAGRASREDLRVFINHELQQLGKNAEPKARESILMRAGDDLRNLRQEIEKLLLYIGDRPTVRLEDVQAIMADQAEGWIFELTRLIAAREPAAALLQLARLMSHGDHPLKLLATIASEVRKLLSARQLLEQNLRGRWRRGMTFNQFQQAIVDSQPTLLSRNPYADYMCFQRAESFSVHELLAHMAAIHAADLRLKSSGANSAVILERLILHMCIDAHRMKPAKVSRA